MSINKNYIDIKLKLLIIIDICTWVRLSDLYVCTVSVICVVLPTSFHAFPCLSNSLHTFIVLKTMDVISTYR